MINQEDAMEMDDFGHDQRAAEIAAEVMEDADGHAVIVDDETEDEPEVAIANVLKQFRLPKAPTILARLPAITNSFANSIIPAIKPTAAEVQEVLQILGMESKAVCAYCGDTATEWDHFRPVVEKKRPTGYVTEINNLVPACGKCNQSKGNKHWRTWMEGGAQLSPTTRGVPDLDLKIGRLQAYEDWSRPTQLDLERAVGPQEWAEYWHSWVEIRDRLTRATAIAAHLSNLVKSMDTPGAGSADGTTDGPGPVSTGTSGVWVVNSPGGVIEAPTKREAARLVILHAIHVGVDPVLVQGLVGATAMRGVPKEAVVDPRDLWDVFAAKHGKEDEDKELWHVDSPVHAAGQIWLIANNVWGPKTVDRLTAVVERTRGQLFFVTPDGLTSGGQQSSTSSLHD